VSFLIEKNLNTSKKIFDAHHTGDPFSSFDFLNALQETNCLDSDSGWITNCLKHENGTAIPFYEKLNSQGEFVFDYAWANTYYRYGQAYYPKLVMSVPFTPVDGCRIIGPNDKSRNDALKSLVNHTESAEYSSLHALFVEDKQKDIFKDQGFIERLDCNYKWKNKSYASFDDFLYQLSSRHRKNMKKERAYIKSLNIEFEHISEITEQDWQDFYLFYSITYAIRGQRPYLTASFFRELKDLNPTIVFAHKKGQRIAAALFFQYKDKLFGRYWGTKEPINFLHFECCYYQGIEIAINNKCSEFDPGIQGHHKLKRGFEPVLNSSFHWIVDERFRDAIKKYCESESKQIIEYFKQSQEYLPFKNA
jgi:predicted N-acyltransferase|tara:strand:- start:1068 stop:2156 length:1089 start_codon:yes stop_codon:yes gene_type:complete